MRHVGPNALRAKKQHLSTPRHWGIPGRSLDAQSPGGKPSEGTGPWGLGGQVETELHDGPKQGGT